jgi:hypothetical protein
VGIRINRKYGMAITPATIPKAKAITAGTIAIKNMKKAL